MKFFLTSVHLADLAVKVGCMDKPGRPQTNENFFTFSKFHKNGFPMAQWYFRTFEGNLDVIWM